MAATLDLFGAWRDALQKWEKETNAALTSATGDERVSRVMGQSLSVMAQLQAKQAEAMEKGLAQASLPSKADFRALNTRLDGIERQLARLSDMVKSLAKADGVTVVAPSIPKPARTRKPPPASGKPAKDGPK
jgi:polyhydroxyalkanoate synthesis regulator phasin